MRTKVLTVAAVLALVVAHGAPAQTIWTATLGQNQKTAEVSTEELRRILTDHSATVFDARPYMEFAAGHIPGAVNVSAKAEVPMSQYVSDVAEVERVLHGDKHAPIILYCNGPFCGKSSRLADELLAAGFTNVRRYQFGVRWVERCSLNRKDSTTSTREITPPAYTTPVPAMWLRPFPEPFISRKRRSRRQRTTVACRCSIRILE